MEILGHWHHGQVLTWQTPLVSFFSFAYNGVKTCKIISAVGNVAFLSNHFATYSPCHYSSSSLPARRRCTYRRDRSKQRLHGRQHYHAGGYKRLLCKGKVKLPLKKRVECFWTTGIERGERNRGKTVILRESFRLSRSSGDNLAEGWNCWPRVILANPVNSL